MTDYIHNFTFKTETQSTLNSYQNKSKSQGESEMKN